MNALDTFIAIVFFVQYYVCNSWMSSQYWFRVQVLEYKWIYALLTDYREYTTEYILSATRRRGYRLIIIWLNILVKSVSRIETPVCFTSSQWRSQWRFIQGVFVSEINLRSLSVERDLLLSLPILRMTRIQILVKVWREHWVKSKGSKTTTSVEVGGVRSCMMDSSLSIEEEGSQSLHDMDPSTRRSSTDKKNFYEETCFSPSLTLFLPFLQSCWCVSFLSISLSFSSSWRCLQEKLFFLRNPSLKLSWSREDESTRFLFFS